LNLHVFNQFRRRPHWKAPTHRTLTPSPTGQHHQPPAYLHMNQTTTLQAIHALATHGGGRNPNEEEET